MKFLSVTTMGLNCGGHLFWSAELQKNRQFAIMPSQSADQSQCVLLGLVTCGLQVDWLSRSSRPLTCIPASVVV